jgi:hypothetical protein
MRFIEAMRTATSVLNGILLQKPEGLKAPIILKMRHGIAGTNTSLMTPVNSKIFLVD